MSNIKAIVALLLLVSATVVSAKPKTAEEWEHCVTQVPAQVEREEGMAGAQFWIDNHCGRTKPVSAKGLPAKDCDRLVEILAECKQQRAQDLWALSDASRGNANSLLGGNKLKQFDAECGRVGQQGGALPASASVKAKYCGAK